MAREHGAEVLSLGTNRGLPVGIAAGYNWALVHGYAYCGRVDADGQHPPAELERLLGLVRADHCDVAVGSRFVSGDGYEPFRYRQDRARRLGTGVLRRAMRVVLRRPFGDATSGLYAVNAKALPILAKPFTTEAPEVEALIRIVDAGLRLEEVPVHMAERAGGESKLRGRKAVRVVLTVTGTLLAARPAGAALAVTRAASGRSLRRIALGVGGLLLVVATFVYFLPKIADYRDVWDVLQDVPWPWAVALLVVAAINILTFAPPWQVALPGLLRARSRSPRRRRRWRSSPCRPRRGHGRIVRNAARRVSARSVTRAVTLTGLWNQFLNLSFQSSPSSSRALRRRDALRRGGVRGRRRARSRRRRLRGRPHQQRARRGRRRGGGPGGQLVAREGGPPGPRGAASFERFRDDAGDLVRRRWHLLTLTSLLGSLSVFAVLLVSLRAVDVPASEVTAVEAFAAWALVRILATVPITPGGLGVVEPG